MKKRICSMIYLCGLVSVMLCACEKQQIETNAQGGIAMDASEKGAETVILKAAVIELDDNSILVEPLMGDPALNSADKINIPNEGDIDLHVGDEIEIRYNGEILETYPAQLGEVYSIKAVKEAVDSQSDQSSQQETWDLIPMVMIDGKLYLDTGQESTAEGRCGVMDGEIISEVDGSEEPTEDNQSNFGTGYEYQYGSMEGTVEIYMNGKWWIFATKEARNEI